METINSEEDHLPPALLQKLKIRSNTVGSTNNADKKIQSSPNESNESSAIRKVLNETGANSGQREKLCASLLFGSYEVLENVPKSPLSPTSSVEVLPPGLTKNLAHLKRHGHQNRFLELESSRAPVHRLPPTAIVSKEKMRRVGMEEKNVSFTWAGQSIRMNPRTAIESPANAADSKAAEARRLKMERQACLAEAVQNSKMETLRRRADHVRQVRDIAMRHREAEQEALAQKHSVHRKLESFREKLKERLLEREDPQSGLLMRCLTNDVVHKFLSTHRGYNMSIDAIIAELTASIASSKALPTNCSNLSRPDEIFDDLDSFRRLEAHRFINSNGSSVKKKPVALNPTRYFKPRTEKPVVGPGDQILSLLGSSVGAYLTSDDRDPSDTCSLPSVPSMSLPSVTIHTPESPRSYSEDEMTGRRSNMSSARRGSVSSARRGSMMSDVSINSARSQT